MLVGVIGLGSIGRRHANNLRRLGHEIIAYDSANPKTEGLKVVSALDELWSAKPKAILVCTPTHLHLEHATSALMNNCNVFIEKPVSDKLNGLKSLEKLSRQKNRIVFVACNLRFHNSISRLKSIIDSGRIGKVLSLRAEFGHYLPNWRQTDYRQSYSAKASEGGGVLLDCIHEFDYVAWFLGKPLSVFSSYKKLSDLNIDSEDHAEVIVEFDSTTAQIHLDYLQQDKRRSCQIIGTKGTAIWASIGKSPETSTISVFDSTWSHENETIDPNAMYFEEMRYFMDITRIGDLKKSNLEEGMRALQMVMAARQSNSRKAVKI